ncbi:MAG: hypothetical protein ACOCZ8_01040 [Bacteroidota bacterium]
MLSVINYGNGLCFFHDLGGDIIGLSRLIFIPKEIMLNRLLPTGTAQRSYMLSLMAMILAALLFFTLGALTKGTAQNSMFRVVTTAVIGFPVLALSVYVIIKHFQGFVRVFNLPKNNAKMTWMLLSVVGGGVFVYLMFWFLWLQMFFMFYAFD